MSAIFCGLKCLRLACLLACCALTVPLAVFARPVVLEEVAKILPPDPGYEFGSSLALDGNDLFVTAYGGGGYGLYHFERQGDGSWLSRGLLATAELQDVQNPNTVSMDDGVIAWTADRGQLQIFERTPAGWRAVSHTFTAAGSDVGVADGLIAVGDENGMGRATVQLGERNAAGQWVMTTELEAAPSYPDNDFLGPGLAVAPTELMATNMFESSVGTQVESHFFELLGGTWQRTTVFPGGKSATRYDGNLALVETGTPSTGDILFLDRRDASGAWSVRARLTSEERITKVAPGPVVVLGDRIYAGAPNNDVRGANSGSVNVFSRDQSAGDRFTHVATLVPSDPYVLENPDPPSWGGPQGGRLGHSIVASGTTVAAAAFMPPETSTGGRGRPIAIYVFDVPEPLPESVRVEDTFQDVNAAGWTPQATTNWRVVTSGGSYVYRQTNTQGDARAILDTPVSRNQSIEADVKVNSFATGTRSWVGLMVRYRDPLNFYYLLAADNRIEIRRIVNGTFGPIASTRTGIVAGRTYRLRLEAVGTWLRAYVDGRLIGQVQDESHSEGRAGLTMWKTNADFDNVIVTASPYTILHGDSFSNTSEEEASLPWTTEPTGAWTYATRSNGATVLRQSLPEGDARAVNGAPARDQIVTADIRPTSFHSSGRGWVGLMTRYVDNRNYYYVLLTDDNRASLRKWVDGRITLLEEVPFTFNPGTSYRVRFEAIGDSLRLYINGRLMAEGTATDLPQGRYGLVTYRAAAEFDTFTAARP